MKHIVLTTDLSDEARSAIGPTGEIADKLGARITLLHVIPEQVAVPYGYPYVPPPSAEEIASYRDHVTEKLEAVAKQLPENVDVTCQIIESNGRIDRAICEFAESNGADAIAMASHGRSGLQRWFLGSVAEAVARSAKTAVHLYRTAEETQD